MKKLVLEINDENEYMRVPFLLSPAVFVITHELSEWKCDNYDICIDL